MQNWNDQYNLTRLHREDLLRDAANARLAAQVARPERSNVTLARAWQPVLALLALLVGTHR
jgi:hypothetical protein